MDHLPRGLNGHIVDLGCGNGVIGLTALAQNPEAQVTFVDESYMAVASSELNVEHNLPQELDRCQFEVNNALAGIERESVQAVLCNPPFHQQHAITDHTAGRCSATPSAAYRWAASYASSATATSTITRSSSVCSATARW